MNKLLAASGLALSLALSATVSAQTTWNMATPYPEAEFHTRNIAQFAEDVSELTNGALRITVHSGQSLFNHPEIRRAVRTGQVDAGEMMMANLANEDPIYAVDNLPFLVDGYETARKLWEAQRPMVEQRMRDNGLILLYTVPWPGQGFYTTRELQSAADLTGLRFRTYNAITANMATLMGATPTTVEAVEIPQAFSAGIVDAMVTSAATGYRTEAWEFSNYYHDLQAWLPKNMVFVNQRSFSRLSDADQAAVLEAAARAEARGWAMSEAVFTETTDNLAQRMTRVEPSEALREGLRAIGAQMAAAWAAEAGEDGQRLLEALR
jgi:TRAP-type transport system periplasmic protein